MRSGLQRRCAAARACPATRARAARRACAPRWPRAPQPRAGDLRRAAGRRTGRLHRPTTWCASSSGCRARRARQRRAGAALRGAALAAGVRSPDARHRAAACRLAKTERALAAPRSDPRAARRRCPNGAAARALLAAGTPRCTRARLHGGRAGARRSTSPPATSTSWCCRRASRGRHELDPFQAYRALRLINPSPYMYYCALGDVTVVGSSPEALVKLNGGQAQLRPIAGTRPRSDDAGGRYRARDANCSPIRRRTPST